MDISPPAGRTTPNTPRDVLVVLAPLCAALAGPPEVPDQITADERAEQGRWRWTTRRRLAELRDLLALESPAPENAWLAASSSCAVRQRNALLNRMGDLGRRILGDEDVDAVRHDLRRLLGDVRRYLQRLHDLAYDDIELELGGSE